MTAKRNYRQTRRAEAQEETRQRIVEAAMALHETVGPRATTISAIADLAGVQRLTVYRHFHDETAIFTACTSHWLDLHPLPDPASWSAIGGGMARARAALEAFYGYYEGTQRMWRASYRDEEAVEALREPMAKVRAFMAAVGGDLAAAIEAPAARAAAVGATVRHVLAFGTWQSLQGLGLERRAAVELALDWIEAARRGRPQQGA